MSTHIGAATLILCLVSAAGARAEPYSILPNGDVVFNVVLTTSGMFTCLRSIPCAGSGTDSITVGTGDQTATLTFRGVERSFQAGNVNTRVNVGSIETVASPGFVWPTVAHPQWPILNFGISLTHDSPVAATRSRTWSFGPGGEPDIALRRSNGGTYSILPAGENPPGYYYTGIAYTYTPFPFSIPANGIARIDANVGAIPEPTTLLLLGSSVACGAYARRRRLNKSRVN